MEKVILIPSRSCWEDKSLNFPLPRSNWQEKSKKIIAKVSQGPVSPRNVYQTVNGKTNAMS